MLADPARSRRLLPALLIGASALMSACGSSGSRTSTPVTSTSNRVAVVAAGSKAQTGACASVSVPAPKGPQQVPKPTLSLDARKRYLVALNTNCGTIDIRLAVSAAPHTTASFAYLVARGFYNGLTFHRVAAGFVIQGGDPNGDGSGGPGYSVIEPPPSNTNYTRGTVAMAKTSADPAGASGSQFFIVTATRAPLPPDYALVGQVVGGMRGVNAIAKLPTDPPQDGAPKTPVVIISARLSPS